MKVKGAYSRLNWTAYLLNDVNFLHDHWYCVSESFTSMLSRLETFAWLEHYCRNSFPFRGKNLDLVKTLSKSVRARRELGVDKFGDHTLPKQSLYIAWCNVKSFKDLLMMLDCLVKLCLCFLPVKFDSLLRCIYIKRFSISDHSPVQLPMNLWKGHGPNAPDGCHALSCHSLFDQVLIRLHILNNDVLWSCQVQFNVNVK